MGVCGVSGGGVGVMWGVRACVRVCVITGVVEEPHFLAALDAVGCLGQFSLNEPRPLQAGFKLKFSLLLDRFLPQGKTTKSARLCNQ